MTPDAASPVGSTPRSRATRSAVLESALEVFVDRGFHSATVDDITARADVAHGTFYRYFENKQDVLNTLVKEAMTRIPHPAYDLASADIFNLVREDVAAFFDNVARHVDLFRIWTEAAAYDDRVANSRRSMRNPFVRRIRDAIQASVGLALIPPINVDVAAEALACMVENFAYVWFVVERRGGDVTELAGVVATLWYRGLGYEQGRHSL